MNNGLTEFRIIPAGKSVYLALAVLSVFMLSVLTTAIWAFLKNITETGLVAQIVSLLMAVVIVGIIIFFGFFGYSARKSTFNISEQGLNIAGNMYGKDLPAESLVPEGIVLLNLKNDLDFRPMFRTNGVSLPGYREGWFRLRNREKALCFLTRTSNVIYLPTTEGYSIIMSVADPTEFKNKAKAVWSKK